MRCSDMPRSEWTALGRCRGRVQLCARNKPALADNRSENSLQQSRVSPWVCLRPRSFRRPTPQLAAGSPAGGSICVSSEPVLWHLLPGRPSCPPLNELPIPALLRPITAGPGYAVREKQVQDRRFLRRPALQAARGSNFGSRASFDAHQSKAARVADVVPRLPRCPDYISLRIRRKREEKRDGT